MKRASVIVSLLFMFYDATSQLNVDSLRNVAITAAEDSSKLKSLSRLASHYKWMVPDSSIYFAMQAIPLARKLDAEMEERDLYFNMGEVLSGKGNFALALETQLKGLKLAEKLNQIHCLLDLNHVLKDFEFDDGI